MADAEMKVPDPKGHLWVPSEQAKAGASPKREAREEENPQEPPLEEDWKDLSEEGPTAPGDPLPAHARKRARGAGGGRGDPRPPACPPGETLCMLGGSSAPLQPSGSAPKGKRALPACEEQSKSALVPKEPLPWGGKEEEERKPGGEASPSPSVPGKERESGAQEAPALRRNEAKPDPGVLVLNCPKNSEEQASGSRTGSDVNKMSSDVMAEFLHCKLKAVNHFQDPAVREFLKIKLWEAKSFFCLLQEKQQLQAQESRLKAANQRLQQELQNAKRNQRTGNQKFPLPWSKTDFHIQVHVTGKTGGCENQFLKKVSDHLSNHRINIKQETYREGCSHFLLVFCPVSSRVGTDMANAVEDLKGEPKAVLVMLHHKPKESNSYVDTKPQAQHPAVVRTVYARYTLDDGFYDCPMNEEAVDAMAEVLEDRCKGGKGNSTTPGAPSKSQNT